MTPEQILGLPSIPASAPSYPDGPFRFYDRAYLIFIYESDPLAIREVLPEPLQPIEAAHVYLEWIRTGDSDAFGTYTQCGTVLPCYLDGERCNFIAQMYLDAVRPIVAGREIWGLPRTLGEARVGQGDGTLVGTLDAAGERVATGTMSYRHPAQARDPKKALAALATPQVNLKLIPDVDGRPAIAQLVGFTMSEIEIKGAWSATGRLELRPNAAAPLADLPLNRLLAARHIVADMTLPYGRVLHDYLKG